MIGVGASVGGAVLEIGLVKPQFDCPRLHPPSPLAA